MEYAEDFQRTGKSESAIVDRQSARLGEYDESVHAFRNKGEFDVDFARTQQGETNMKPLGTLPVGADDKHAHAHAYRDVEQLSYGEDFQRAGVNATAMVERSSTTLGDYAARTRSRPSVLPSVRPPRPPRLVWLFERISSTHLYAYVP